VRGGRGRNVPFQGMIRPSQHHFFQNYKLTINNMALLGDRHAVAAFNPMPVNDLTNSTDIVAVAGETITVAAGAAGTAVGGAFDKAPIYDDTGARIGNETNSSISWTTGTMFTTEVGINYRALETLHAQKASTADIVTEMTDGLANGEYVVDYENGVLYGVKATAATTDIAGYNTRAFTVVVAAPGVTAHAEDTAHTSGDIGTQLLTVRQDFGSQVGTPLAGTEGDYQPLVTANTGALLGVDINVSTQDAAISAFGPAVQYEAATFDGSALPNAVTAEGDSQSPKCSLQGVQFVSLVTADGSDFGQIAGYDTGTDSVKVFEVNPVSDHHVEETLADVTNETSATSHYYMDMDGYRYFSLQLETSGGTPADTLTVTVEATNQDDGTAATSCTYQDVTQALFGVASWVDTDAFAIVDTPVPFKYVRIKTVTAGGNNDADYTIYAKKMF